MTIFTRDENGSDTNDQIQIHIVIFFLGSKSDMISAKMCRISILILFESYKYNFEYPNTDTVRIGMDIECPDSDRNYSFECLNPFDWTNERILSIPLSSLIFTKDV